MGASSCRPKPPCISRLQLKYWYYTDVERFRPVNKLIVTKVSENIAESKVHYRLATAVEQREACRRSCALIGVI
jgi:hypothetical protein